MPDYTLTVNPATISLSGGSVNVEYNRVLTVSPATITLTGGSVNVELNRVLTVSPATITLTPATVNMNLSPPATFSSQYDRVVWSEGLSRVTYAPNNVDNRTAYAPSKGGRIVIAKFR